MSRLYRMPRPDRAPSRPTPSAPPGAFQSFEMHTYWRTGTCADVQCDAHVNGWVTVVDTTTSLGRDQADYIRFDSGRRYHESSPGPGQVRFEFPPGQTCFAKHGSVQDDRPALFLRRGGDWRAATGGRHVYDRPDQMADDMHTITDRLHTIRSRAGTSNLKGP